MLRVGLTGGLGSGKSTVAALLRALGAEIVEADELGRALMEPGQAVYDRIVEHFGSQAVAADERLDRKRVGEMAFGGGRLQELNAIVHPAVIEAQRLWMEGVYRRHPRAIAVIESALIFEVVRDAKARGERDTVLADWRNRMDRVIVVAAPEPVRVARYAARMAAAGMSREAAEADARRRISHQIPEPEKVAQADYVIENPGDVETLRAEVTRLWPRLEAERNCFRPPASLK